MSTRRGRCVAPGPEWHPITEQLHAFEKAPLDFLQTAHRDYGDVVRLHLWPHLFHLVAHPDAIHHVLGTNHRNYHQAAPGSSPGLPVNSPVLARRLSSTFRHEQARAFTTAMAEVVEEMLSRWQHHAARGEPIDLAEEMLSLTLVIVTRTLFAAAPCDEDLRKIGWALKVASTRTGPHLSVSDYQRRARPGDGADLPLTEAAAMLGQFVAGLIEQRRSAGRGIGDLLGALVFARDEQSGEALSDEKLRETVMVYLIAGYSTTASALTWTFSLLARSEEVQVRLRTEVDAVLERRSPTAEDLARLPYAKLVLREAMRLYPPVWMLAPRVALAEDEIGGYRIPARSRILISPYVTHRHPDLWERPEAFVPHRFTRSPQARAYLPFGAGPWGCVGRQFGVLEALLVVARAAARFRWELVPDHPVEPDPQAALWPRHRLRMVLHVRERRRHPALSSRHTAGTGRPDGLAASCSRRR